MVAVPGAAMSLLAGLPFPTGKVDWPPAARPSCATMPWVILEARATAILFFFFFYGEGFFLGRCSSGGIFEYVNMSSSSVAGSGKLLARNGDRLTFVIRCSVFRYASVLNYPTDQYPLARRGMVQDAVAVGTGFRSWLGRMISWCRASALGHVLVLGVVAARSNIEGAARRVSCMLRGHSGLDMARCSPCLGLSPHRENIG